MRVVEGGVAQENLARGLRRRHGLCRLLLLLLLLRRLHGRPGRRRPRPEEGPDVLFDGRGGQRVRLPEKKIILYRLNSYS